MTRQQAITAHCKSCIHDPLSPGTWREQVALCSSSNCALHKFRPMPKGGRTSELKAKIDAARTAKGLPPRYAEAV